MTEGAVVGGAAGMTFGGSAAGKTALTMVGHTLVGAGAGFVGNSANQLISKKLKHYDAKEAGIASAATAASFLAVGFTERTAQVIGNKVVEKTGAKLAQKVGGAQIASTIAGASVQSGFQGAVAGLAGDVTYQALSVATERQDKYNPAQTAGSTLLGGFVGSVVGGAMKAKASVGKGGRTVDDAYVGVKQASEYLKQQGVPRQYRKQILESFDIRTIKLETAGDRTYGLRFYGGNANAEGRYLFETFSPLTNRANLALPYEWNNMTGNQQFHIKKGTVMITGSVAPQTRFGIQYTGGAKQWYINSLEAMEKCQ